MPVGINASSANPAAPAIEWWSTSSISATPARVNSQRARITGVSSRTVAAYSASTGSEDSQGVNRDCMRHRLLVFVVQNGRLPTPFSDEPPETGHPARKSFSPGPSADATVPARSESSGPAGPPDAGSWPRRSGALRTCARIARPRLMMYAAPGASARTLFGSTLYWCCILARAFAGRTLLRVVAVSTRILACAGERDDLLGGVHAVADHGLHRPEDPGGSRLRRPCPATTCGARRGGVEPAGLLDPGGHPRALREERRTHRRSARRTVRGACGSRSSARSPRTGTARGRSSLRAAPGSPSSRYAAWVSSHAHPRRARRGSVRRTPRSAAGPARPAPHSAPPARSNPGAPDAARRAPSARAPAARSGAARRGARTPTADVVLAMSRYHDAGPSLGVVDDLHQAALDLVRLPAPTIERLVREHPRARGRHRPSARRSVPRSPGRPCRRGRTRARRCSFATVHARRSSVSVFPTPSRRTPADAGTAAPGRAAPSGPRTAAPAHRRYAARSRTPARRPPTR